MSEQPAVRHDSATAWCLDFIERRCGASVSALLRDESRRDVAERAAETCALSLAEVSLGAEADAPEQEHMAVLALGIGGVDGTTAHRVVLRFVTPGVMRSAARAEGSRSVITDIVVPTPSGLIEVSLLVYRIHRTLRLQRVLAAIENMIETSETVGDDEDLVLARAVLERLEVLDGDEDAKAVLGASRILLVEAKAQGEERFLAVVAGDPGSAAVGHLWLKDRVLCEGLTRDTAAPVTGRAFALLRFGARSTRQSVREFIDEIRTRHQRRAGEPTLGAEGESFASFVDRDLAKRKQKQVQDFINRLGLGANERLLVEIPIAMEVSDDVGPLFKGSTPQSLSDAASRGVEALRNRVAAEMGIRIPGIRFRVNSGLVAASYSLLFHESFVARGQFRTDKRFLPGHVSEATLLGIEVQSGHHPTAGEGVWIAPEDVPRVPCPVWDVLDFPLRHLEQVALDNLQEFFGYEEATVLLSENAGKAAKAINNDPILVARFANVLRRLIREKVPVLSFDRICDGFVRLHESHIPLLECVERIRMLDGVRDRLPGNDVRRTFVRLGPKMMDSIRQSLRFEEGRLPTLNLDPDVAQDIVSRLREALGNPQGRCTLVAPETPLRTYVSALMRYEVVGVPVLAADELLFEPIATVQVDID